MAKVADVYYKQDPWRIVEEGFDPAYAQVSESVFSLANEYMGVRGYPEEGYSGDSLVGSYFNGIYEQKQQETSGYVGISDVTEFMVNAVDWLYLRITAGEEALDLYTSTVHSFKRVLDMKTGLLTRSFIWKISEGQEMKVTFERILSMKQVEHAAQKVTLESLSYKGSVQIQAGLDGTRPHVSAKKNYWVQQKVITGDSLGKDALGGFKVTEKAPESAVAVNVERNYQRIVGLELKTEHTGQYLTSAIHLAADGFSAGELFQEDKKLTLPLSTSIKPGQTCILERTVCNLVCRRASEYAGYQERQSQIQKELESFTFNDILRENQDFWGEIWRSCDIEIKGDPENQQGIRFCIFQLFQTYQGAVEGSNIGAKGLTGEAYNGNAFWDTETYCLPFFLFNDMEGARNLLLFRYQTLPEARKRAKELDCRGAFYPVATISGKECCNLWQHASLQMQASTAVAYGIWFYEKMSGDVEFLKNYGMEMLIEISRMLATRGDYSNDGSSYGYFGVMGPDEFQMMVNHNCYTNYMGRFTLRYTLECLDLLGREYPEDYKRVVEITGYQFEEGKDWKQKADKTYIPYDEKRKLFEQHRGFFELPHVDVDKIPVEDFPLYSHWSYDHIYRNDMIKQPDVLMLLLLFNSSFTQEQLQANYEYYEPRCIHESSLSPSVHSILASQLGKAKEAYDFFRFATRMDLDNYNRNSGEGIHTTSIAAAWMNIVYGFGGLRSDGEMLKLCPAIPEKWEEYSFRLHYQGEILIVRVRPGSVSIQAEHDRPVTLLVYDKPVTLGNGPVKLEMPADR